MKKVKIFVSALLLSGVGAFAQPATTVYNHTKMYQIRI